MLKRLGERLVASVAVLAACAAPAGPSEQLAISVRNGDLVLGICWPGDFLRTIAIQRGPSMRWSLEVISDAEKIDGVVAIGSSIEDLEHRRDVRITGTALFPLVKGDDVTVTSRFESTHFIVSDELLNAGTTVECE